MKKEIEIKVLNIDKRKLRIALKRLGARRILEPTLMREIYWESPAKECTYSSLRLRSEGKNIFLTLKLKQEDRRFEIHHELEVEVSDFNTLQKILELANFIIFRQREKIREEYDMGGVKIEIDEYPSMAAYMEVEASSKKNIEDFLEKLGFPLEYTTKKTATEIIRDAGLNPDNLLFEKKK